MADSNQAIVLGLLNNPDELEKTVEWQGFRSGVDIHRLYETENSRAALLRYEAGASVPEHEHTGWEHILVLRGSQSDEKQDYSQGSLIIHPPGSTHKVKSEEGCLVLAIWEKPVAFLEGE